MSPHIGMSQSKSPEGTEGGSREGGREGPCKYVRNLDPPFCLPDSPKHESNTSTNESTHTNTHSIRKFQHMQSNPHPPVGTRRDSKLLFSRLLWPARASWNGPCLKEHLYTGKWAVTALLGCIHHLDTD
eukprot:364552-Chlamydomonas_euryale.AAC.10